jgi:hypothetical protein
MAEKSHLITAVQPGVPVAETAPKAYPPLEEVEEHIRAVRAALRVAGVPNNTIGSIQTKAYRTGRKTTGEFATNRETRWSIATTHPQYGTEHDCKVIFVKLCAQIFCFDNAPELPTELRAILEQYLDHSIAPNTYRDKLLLERFDFNDLVEEGLNPTHGHSSFHIGHEDPTLIPKHQANNIGWRTLRSNMIQGEMTLRQTRVYFLKLIGRYFELEELDIS